LISQYEKSFQARFFHEGTHYCSDARRFLLKAGRFLPMLIRPLVGISAKKELAQTPFKNS
jgi:hypothetical protein